MGCSLYSFFAKVQLAAVRGGDRSPHIHRYHHADRKGEKRTIKQRPLSEFEDGRRINCSDMLTDAR